MRPPNISTLARSLYIICTLFAFSPAAWAQTASLSGTINDSESGAHISEANVRLNSTSTEFTRGAAADTKGRFSIDELEAGAYTLYITAIGYRSSSRDITLQSGQALDIDVELRPQQYELSEIVVEASDEEDVSPTTVQRISADAIENQGVATASVADVARLLPAAHVATNSRGQTILYLRNSADRQTAQFFNGALINVPWDNRVDLSFLPAAMLGGVTVSKGVPSIKYGTNTIGGAVNFRPRTLASASPGSVTELSATGTLPGTGGASILHMGRSETFSYTAEASYSKRNDYTIPDGADLPYSQPSGDTRVNTDRRHYNFFVQGGKSFSSGAQIGATVFHADAEKGVAPESNLNPQETGVRYWRYPSIRQSMVMVNGNTPLATGTRLRGSAWFNRYTQDIYQYQSVAYETLDETQDDLDLTGGLRLILEQRLGSGELDLSLNALTTQHQQTIVPYSGGTAQADSNDTYGQQIYSLGAEYTLPLSSKATGILGIGYEGSAITNTGPWETEGYEQYLNSAFSFSAGLTYQLSNRLTLRSVVGRKPRFPTMRELYNGALGKFVPNPNLEPVTAYLGELGMEWTGTAFSGSLTAFHTRTHDTIDKTTIQNGPDAGKEQRINIDGTRIWGVEAVAAAKPFGPLTVDGSLTYMHIRGFQDGDPRKLDEKPAWLGVLTTTYDITPQLRALLQTEYTGGIYTRTEQNTFVGLPDALVFDGRLGYRLFQSTDTLKGGELFMRVNNITNDQRILQLGLPGPGREYLAGINVRF